MQFKQAQRWAEWRQAFCAAKQAKDADTKALEKRLTDTLGLKIAIAHKQDKGAGELKIKYASLEQLDEICRLLGVPS